MTILETLILGSYLFTVGVYKYLSAKIDKFINNHLKHVDERLARLENFHKK